MEILPGVHTVPGVSWSRVYLIEDKTLALVDSGLPWSARRVLDYITSIGRRHDELELILTTHSHPDHTTGARSISRRTDGAVVAHRLDTRTASGGQVTLSFMGAFNSLPLPVPFLARTPVGRLVTDDEVLPLLGGLRVIHTPGHTPGSVCYLAETRGVLFSGDTAFSDGKRVSRSVPFPGYNGPHYRESLQRLARLEFDTLCGGHGAPLVGGASDRLRELLARSPDPPTWGEFLRSIPGRLYRGRSLTGEDL